MVTFSRGMPPSPHQWVLLITGDILSFPVCSQFFQETILPTQDSPPHPTALPQASTSCPVLSLFVQASPTTAYLLGWLVGSLYTTTQII